MSYQQSEILKYADELYAKRERRENVRQSLNLLRGVLKDTPRYEVDWRLGRACFFLGQEAQTTTEASNLHQEGITACRRAVRERAGSVEANFWLGVNLALAAAARHSLFSIPLVIGARRVLQRAVEIEESYHGAGPLRVLARLMHKSPGWLGGARSKSLDYYERAVLVVPENTVTRIYFAELLIEMGDENRAQDQLETVLRVGQDATWAFEIKRDKILASQMLNTLKLKSGLRTHVAGGLSP